MNKSPTFLPFLVGTPFKENLNLQVVSEVRVALGDAFSIVDEGVDTLLLAICVVVVLMGENASHGAPRRMQRTARIVGSEQYFMIVFIVSLHQKVDLPFLLLK